MTPIYSNVTCQVSKHLQKIKRQNELYFSHKLKSAFIPPIFQVSSSNFHDHLCLYEFLNLNITRASSLNWCVQFYQSIHLLFYPPQSPTPWKKRKVKIENRVHSELSLRMRIQISQFSLFVYTTRTQLKISTSRVGVLRSIRNLKIDMVSSLSP